MTDLPSWTSCGICLLPILNATSGICGHPFCLRCINIWRRSSDNCPKCRYDYKGQLVRQHSLDDAIHDVLKKVIVPATRIVKEDNDDDVLTSSMYLDRSSGKWVIDFHPDSPEIHLGTTGKVFTTPTPVRRS
jgi:hypothetical protein